MSTMRITILSGYASPKTLEFEEGQSEIRIGRAPEAEVRLDPTRDKASSRGVHARLVRGDDGAWMLECMHSSGVGVVGKGDRVVRRLEEGQNTPVLEGLTFEIGLNGPRLRAMDASAALPGTEVKESNIPVVPHVPQDVIGKARGSSRRVRIVSLVGIAAIAIGAFTIFMVNRSSQQGVAGAREETHTQIADVQSHIAEVKGEAHTGLEELRTLTTEQATTVESQIGDLKGDLARVEKLKTDQMNSVLATVADSVWSVGVEDSAGRFSLVGTAWTVAPDMLATNAHVANDLDKRLQDLSTHGTLVARRKNASKGQLLIKVAKVHPGYLRWSQAMVSQFASHAGGGAKQIGFISPADVATLRVVSGDPGEPLPLAGSDSSSPAARGALVGYVGYPAENLAGLPTKESLVGRVTAITDFFFGEDPSGENLLIHYDAPTAGGASGSPLVNRLGEVIGVVSGGSNVMTESQDRIPLGFNYAQSVAFVSELLAGNADANQANRNARWGKRLRAVTLPSKDLMDQLAVQTFRAHDKNATFETVGKGSYQLKKEGANNAIRAGLSLESGRRYVIVAVADDWTDIDLYIFNDDKEVVNDRAKDWYPAVSVGPFDETTDVRVIINAAEAPLSGECHVTLRAYMAKAQSKP